MLKKYLSYLISGLLLVSTAAPLAVAGQAPDKKEKQATTVEDVKIKISKLGLGEKARATITQKNGTKTKGYVARAGEEDFVIRDRKSDNPTTIRYADVAKVESNRGHSNAKYIGIGAGIGVATVFIVIFGLFVGHG